MTPHYYNTCWKSYDYHFYILHLNKHFLPTTAPTHYYCNSTTTTATAKGSYSSETKAPWTKSTLIYNAGLSFLECPKFTSPSHFSISDIIKYIIK